MRMVSKCSWCHTNNRWKLFVTIIYQTNWCRKNERLSPKREFWCHLLLSFLSCLVLSCLVLSCLALSSLILSKEPGNTEARNMPSWSIISLCCKFLLRLVRNNIDFNCLFLEGQSDLLLDCYSGYDRAWVRTHNLSIMSRPIGPGI